jgi:hypothetical protein
MQCLKRYAADKRTIWLYACIVQQLLYSKCRAVGVPAGPTTILATK